MGDFAVRHVRLVIGTIIGCVFLLAVVGLGLLTVLAVQGKVPALVVALPLIGGLLFGLLLRQALRRGYDEWGVEPASSLGLHDREPDKPRG